MGKHRDEFEGYNREMGFDQRIDYSGGTNPIYVGRAYPGAGDAQPLWQIYKMEWDGSNNMTHLRWADATDDFTKIWISRISYDYLDI